MEFLDEDSKPKFLFQSRSIPQPLNDPQDHRQYPNKPILFITVSLSTLLIALSLLFLESEPLKSLVLWVSFSLLIGPLAPSHTTGGDFRVGQGPIIDPPAIVDETDSSKKPLQKKRLKSIRSDESIANSNVVIEDSKNAWLSNGGKSEVLEGKRKESIEMEEEKDWTEEDVELLKKQMVKNPVGKPGRWEVITEVFKGRHKVESVIKKSKEMGERKLNDGDSYTQFLKNRKPLDARSDGEEKKKSEAWSGGEDIALLNALKAYPKEVAMRWEKIEAAVKGKTKADCIKRVAELKKGFRSSKLQSGSTS